MNPNLTNNEITEGIKQIQLLLNDLEMNKNLNHLIRKSCMFSEKFFGKQSQHFCQLEDIFSTVPIKVPHFRWIKEDVEMVSHSLESILQTMLVDLSFQCKVNLNLESIDFRMEEKNIFYIESKCANSKQSGTGVLINCQSSSILVTCLHVVSYKNKINEKITAWKPGYPYSERTAIEFEVNSTRLGENCPEDARDLVILKSKSELDLGQGIQLCNSGDYETNKNQEISIYGYPLGNKYIEKICENQVSPLEFRGRIARKTLESIYLVQGEVAQRGVSGGPVVSCKNLVGVYRGKWEFGLGVVIGSYWIKKLIKLAGYE